MKRLAVVLVNYETPELAVRCLESLAGQVDPGRDRAVVVDNASRDGSAEKIAAAIRENHWEPWAEILQSPRNGGFSTAANLGFKAVRAAMYLLLNSDTVLEPGAVNGMVRAMQENPKAGILGPRLEFPDGRPQISCFRDRSPVSEFLAACGTRFFTALFRRHQVALPVSEIPMEPEWVSFACVLIRDEVVRQIGFMDEGYFLFFEDLDYCRRARKAGWHILYRPEARVIHLRGQSSPVKELEAARKRLPAYYYRSRARYFSKFYGTSGFYLANLLWMLGRGISLARERITHRETAVCEMASRDNWMLGGTF